MTVFAQARGVLGFVWSHPANSGRRMAAVRRAIGFQLRARMGRPVLTAIGERGLMWAELHVTAASKVRYANPPDWNEMRAWEPLLRPGDLFVDVGSNVGAYALWAGDLGATVIAVEPGSASVRRLRRNVALNDFPISVVQCALAERPGLLRLTGDKDTMNHLVFDADGPGERVAVDTLDNVLADRRAAGVKIDVEGAERLVLEGARRALSEHRIGVLQLEWNTMSRKVLSETRAPVAELLREYGYTFMRPDARGRLHPLLPPEESATDLFAVAPGRLR
ncbi:FkbM family methyltransferase [Glycomyces sp. L485]|uniref:FkbM family methyltransferase n=1 Tax=Glycomyces sp. L485 TaxID=2909235 RepID=UPI001F4B8BA5|nr:FkbM family methyltransferase [Glycomyces sp. L485]MCH7230598.1 FkbM family methyltransferase [Glycomyces sp. L485]